MYNSIDKINFYSESPFISDPLNGDVAQPNVVVQHELNKEEFSGKLTAMLCTCNRLNKTSANLLKALIKDNLDKIAGATPVSYKTQDLATMAGYKSLSSVYNAISILSTAGFIAVQEMGRGDGTASFFLNPRVFGRNWVTIGTSLRLVV